MKKYYTIKRKRNLNTLTGILFLLLIAIAMLGGEYSEYKRTHTQPMVKPFVNSGSEYDNTLAVVYVDNGETISKRQLSGSDTVTKPETTEAELIKFYSEEYQVNQALVTCIIKKESTFNPKAVGDSGKAIGYAQFWHETWIRMRKQMGLETTDLRTDKAEAIKTLCWGLANGRGKEWSTFKKCI